jgi:hypothetical protein
VGVRAEPEVRRRFEGHVLDQIGLRDLVGVEDDAEREGLGISL